ncbi:spermidine synthase [Sphingomonas floccifaciens]|uniref:Spermidine synthase n=1 Tax=Sphingomonas floccifaciens TaxID=1844115 RepID=A0ABW4NFN7_9SPHN
MIETAAPPASRAGRALFVATILTGSFLLFLVQPMVARMALPRLGGAPAVWNSAMLVYQALLLGGYAYAHALSKLRPRQSAAVHLGVLAIAALWLPIGLYDFEMPADAEPAVWVPWLLGASIGPLFFAVSAQAPLMQRWYAVAAPGRDPYALYAASNIGSFGGLIAYPLIVEPTMALGRQSLVWSAGYVALFLLVAGCAWRLPRRAEAAEIVGEASPPAPVRRVLLWIALAFVPSGLMLATSTFLTTDIVAVPLLWVLPLGLYLLSFSVAFAVRRGIADTITRFAPVTILLFGGVMIAGHNAMPYLNAGIALLLLFVVAVALHTRMYDLRPAPDRLTGFYLAMSVGGALGGVFSGLVAPVVFDWTYEYPLLVLAAGLLVPQTYLLPMVARLWASDRRGMWLRIAIVAIVVAGLAAVAIRQDVQPGGGTGAENVIYLVLCVLGILLVGQRTAYMIALFGALMLFGGWRALEVTIEGQHRTRSYFGVYTIRNYAYERTLAHGTTLHGIQLTGTPERERFPTSYYVWNSGVGIALRMAPELYGPNARVGAVGLGTGTLACYAKAGQRWSFYEIDPAVVALARNPAKFTFLSRCLPQARIVVGDARMRLAQEPAASLDVLVLDAFSSDAIPMHLMTREAFETYARVLPRNGVLLVHTSNRFLNLEPVVAASARGWMGAMLQYQPHENEGPHATMSDWIVLTRDPSTFARVISDGSNWRPLYPRRDLTPWTDDYATILPVLRAFQ